MRIIAGEFRGRRLKAPAKDDRSIRPSSDRLREALFNILFSAGVVFPGSCGLDLFAGTGALGLEAASRGAKAVSWFDDEPKAVALIRANLAALGLAERPAFQVHQLAVRRVLHSEPRALAPHGPLAWIFLDPPYAHEDTLAVIGDLAKRAADPEILQPRAVVVLEISKRDARDFAAAAAPALEIFDRRIYGEAQLLFWRKTT